MKSTVHLHPDNHIHYTGTLARQITHLSTLTGQHALETVSSHPAGKFTPARNAVFPFRLELKDEFCSSTV